MYPKAQLLNFFIGVDRPGVEPGSAPCRGAVLPLSLTAQVGGLTFPPPRRFILWTSIMNAHRRFMAVPRRLPASVPARAARLGLGCPVEVNRMTRSRRGDSNPRSLGPEPSAIPNFATPSQIWVEGFEPPILCSQSRCDTRLRYTQS